MANDSSWADGAILMCTLFSAGVGLLTAAIGHLLAGWEGFVVMALGCGVALCLFPVVAVAFAAALGLLDSFSGFRKKEDDDGS